MFCNYQLGISGPSSSRLNVCEISTIIYKVQFISSGQRIPLLADKFKGLKGVGEYLDNGFYKYTAGEFKTVGEAMKYRGEMQSKGYADCFVVKFKDGKRMKNDK